MKAAMLIVVLALVAAPGVQGALNPDRPFEQDAGYVDTFDQLSNVVSASVQVAAAEAHNGSVFLGASMFLISGVTQMCWQPDDSSFPQCEQGTNLIIQVEQGSSIALRHPDRYAVSFDADFGLSFFGNAESMFGESNSENLGFGPALISIPVNGATDVDLGVLPDSDLSTRRGFNEFVDSSALLLTFTPDSQITLIRDDGGTVDRLFGAGQYVGFQGAPQVETIHAAIVGIPTPDGTEARFEPADDAAAEQGLSAPHLDQAFAALSASEGSADAQMVQDIQAATEGLSGILNGAYLGLDAENGTGGAANFLAAATVVRFNDMSATRNGESLAVTGSGPLQMQNGQVVGADPLILIFPWWSLILWAVALGGFVLRVMMRPDKHHPVWDKFSWVGLAGGVAASVILFWLWDAETKALWGTSFLSSGASGAALGVISVVQFLPLLFASIAIGLPVQMIVKSGTRFAGQGNFMRIGAIIAPFLVLLLGAGLMLDYLGMLVDALQRFA